KTVGLEIQGALATGNVVLGNRIGTDISGTAALGNATGVQIERGGTANTIGGGNVLSGNMSQAVLTTDLGTSGKGVPGNRIGDEPTGTTSLGNGNGITLLAGATANTIGGTALGAANVVSGNVAYGVLLTNPGTSGNVVLGNRIGTDAFGSTPLGNSV